MKKRPRTYWPGRLLRGRRFDRNPLRRGSDRAESAVLAALLAAFLAAAPLTAHAAGSWVYAASAGEAQAQRAVLHHVPATVLQPAPAWNAYAYADNGALPGVMARWRAPDGQVRTGELFIRVGAASTVLVWTNQAGRLADPPLGHAQVVGRARLAAGAAAGSSPSC